MKIKIFIIKPRSIRHIWIIILMVSTLYFSCRKMDQLQKNSVETSVAEIENRFFREHASPDPTVLTLMNYIERKNNTGHFVAKTVERIGYAYWDKALLQQKPGSNETIRQKVNNIRSNTAGTTGSVTTNIYYIPFVRDEQNHVNASLVIKTTPTDTSFSYVCDWQYKDKKHGLPSSDTTAEHHALFFMMLDNRTLGHKEYIIKDSRLFSKPGINEVLKKITLNLEKASEIKTNSAVYVQDCLSYGLCGSPQACYERGGCDWASGCPVGCCYPDEYCNGWWEFDQGGGSTGNGFGGDGSSSSSGGGSNGSGGNNNTPPDCSDPANKHAEGCEEGWEPIDQAEADMEWFNSTPTYNIDFNSANVGPCISEIIKKVVSSENTVASLIKEKFSESAKFNIKFEIDNTIPGAGQTVPMMTYEKRNNLYGKFVKLNITIKINTAHNGTKLSIAQAVIHEMIHAYFIYREIDAFGNAVKEQQLEAELGFLKPYDPNAPSTVPNSQHEQMAASYIGKIVKGLKAYQSLSASDLDSIKAVYPNITIDEYYEGLAWGGLMTKIVNGQTQIISKAFELFQTNDSAKANKYLYVAGSEAFGTERAAGKTKCN